MPKEVSPSSHNSPLPELLRAYYTLETHIHELEFKLEQIEKNIIVIESQIQNSIDNSTKAVGILQRQLENSHEYSNQVTDALQAQYNQVLSDKNHLQWLLSAVYDSTSWKITGPLRNLGDLLKSQQRKCGSVVHFFIKVLVDCLTLAPLRSLLSKKRATTKTATRVSAQHEPTLPVTPEDTDRLTHDILRQTLPPRAQAIYKKLVEECYL